MNLDKLKKNILEFSGWFFWVTITFLLLVFVAHAVDVLSVLVDMFNVLVLGR
jgi:hypothetical protein